MAKIFMTKHKTLTAIIATSLALIILLGGTFAWQSINQEALNEVYGIVNPGGRLHDDFNNITFDEDGNQVYDTLTFDKNVYVENFTTLATNGVQIFARIRLDEYMEFGVDAGIEGNTTAQSLVYGAKLDDKTTWTTHIPGNLEDPFHLYWNWDTTGDNEGKVTYMPTFNKNKDSLQADINGTFDADFTDYTDYTNVTSKESVAVYDKDGNTVDEIVDNNYTAEYAETCGHVTTKQETHTSKESQTGYVITMDQWADLPFDQQVGNFWVWDNDGWAYWAAPINPDTATGLLLDGISRTNEIINEDWYYGINVVAQFITKEDMGKETSSGFYDTDAGVSPSSNALRLLHAIGVDVTASVSDAAALDTALDIGGIITVNGDINGETKIYPWGEENYSQFTAEYMMTKGGKLSGGKLSLDEGHVFGLVVMASGSSNRESVLEDIAVEGNSESLIYIGSNDSKVTLTDVTATANGGTGIYAEYAQGGVVLNNCIVNQSGITEDHNSWFETAVAAAQGAEIIINGGEYSSTKYAVRIFTTGGTVIINGGTFVGELMEDVGDIIIKGGSFSVDPSAFLADGYTAEQDEHGMWIVK